MGPMLRAVLPCLAGALIACSPEAEVDRPSHSVVFSQLTFARAEEGVSVGFDLDGEVTANGDPSGCGRADFTSPDGSLGVDNATARLLPFLDSTEAVALEPIIQQEINNGGVLLILELIGLEDPTEDATVDLQLRHGIGEPLVGTDNFLMPGQTLEEDTARVGARALDVAWQDGVLEASGFEVVVPVEVFDFSADFHVQESRIRLQRDDDGVWTGLFAGQVDWQGLMDVVQNSGIDDTLTDALPPLLDSISDLPDANGDCTLLSATLEFVATDVFVFGPE